MPTSFGNIGTVEIKRVFSKHAVQIIISRQQFIVQVQVVIIHSAASILFLFPTLGPSLSIGFTRLAIQSSSNVENWAVLQSVATGTRLSVFKGRASTCLLWPKETNQRIIQTAFTLRQTCSLPVQIFSSPLVVSLSFLAQEGMHPQPSHPSMFFSVIQL